MVTAGEWEEMCIVAIEENTAIVLQTQLFQDLLISIGLTPPSNQVYVHSVCIQYSLMLY